MEFNKLTEDARNARASKQDHSEKLAKKWAKTGLLEGLNTATDQMNMALMLENQASQIIAEQSNTGTGGTFSPGQGEQWAGVVLPIVRKVFAQIAAKDFVSVQPMNLPSGLVFFLDYRYGTDKAPYAAGDNMYGTLDVLDEDPTGGLYGEGRYTYSINNKTVEDIAFTVGAASLASINYDDEKDPADFREVAVALADLPEADVLGVRGFQLVNGTTVLQDAEYTRVAGPNVVFVCLEADINGLVAGDIDAIYQVQPKDNSRGDFEDRDPANPIVIPQVDIDLRSEAVVAKTRKLKAQWTPEYAQDLAAYQNIDAEAELTALLSEYISMEIDLEILDMLINDARTTERWSVENNKVWDAATNAWVPLNSDFYNTQGQWFQTLGTKIQKVSNKIHQKTLRGGANFLVCSPNVATILESIPGYAADTDGDKMDFAMGVQKVGQLNSRFRVYKNPYMTENSILMGYRGSQYLETGAAYCPYIPLMLTPLVYDPETFTPRKGIMTRYAKKMLRAEFYGRIFVSDLDLI